MIGIEKEGNKWNITHVVNTVYEISELLYFAAHPEEKE